MKIEELNKKQYDHQRYLKNKEKFLKRAKEWAKNNSERRRELQRNWRRKEYWGNPSYRKKVIQTASKYSKNSASRIRREVIEYYGGFPPKCSLCRILDYEVLSIDHIFGNGSFQRRKENLRGSKFYYWLKKRNFPEEYRVLCRNCNWKEYLKRKGEKFED